MPIRCKIADGRVFVDPDEREAIAELCHALRLPVPGAQYTPLFKSHKWDGFKKFFDMRNRSFAVGHLTWASKAVNDTFTVLEDCRTRKVVPYIPVTVKKGDAEFSLRDFQEETARLLLANHGGIAHLATNAGKTPVIAAVAWSLATAGYNVLILESMINLLDQVKAEIEGCIGCQIGEYSAKVKEFRKITIAMVPSLNSGLKAEIKSGKSRSLETALSKFKAVIADEAHHSRSNSYQNILDTNRDSMRFGFSGTIPPEDDFEGATLRGLFGDVVKVVSNEQLIERGISAVPKITMVSYAMPEQFTSDVDDYKKEVRPQCLKCIFPNPKGFIKLCTVCSRKAGEPTYERCRLPQKKTEFCVPTYTNKIRTYVMENAVRENADFMQVLKKLYLRGKGKSTVIISDWVEYAEDIAAVLGVPAFHGNTPNRAQILKDFSKGKVKGLVATSVLDEGISIDRIEVLIIAATGYSTRQFLQRLGRGLRRKEGDNTLQVYDFIRFGHDYLLAPSKERLKLWKSEGFDIDYLNAEEL